MKDGRCVCPSTAMGALISVCLLCLTHNVSNHVDLNSFSWRLVCVLYHAALGDAHNLRCWWSSKSSIISGTAVNYALPLLTAHASVCTVAVPPGVRVAITSTLRSLLRCSSVISVLALRLSIPCPAAVVRAFFTAGPHRLVVGSTPIVGSLGRPYGTLTPAGSSATLASFLPCPSLNATVSTGSNTASQLPPRASPTSPRCPVDPLDVTAVDAVRSATIDLRCGRSAKPIALLHAVAIGVTRGCPRGTVPRTCSPVLAPTRPPGTHTGSGCRKREREGPPPPLTAQPKKALGTPVLAQTDVLVEKARGG